MATRLLFGGAQVADAYIGVVWRTSRSLLPNHPDAAVALTS